MKRPINRLFIAAPLCALTLAGTSFTNVAKSQNMAMNDCSVMSVELKPTNLVPGEKGELEIKTDKMGPCRIGVRASSPGIEVGMPDQWVKASTDTLRVPVMATTWSGKHTIDVTGSDGKCVKADVRVTRSIGDDGPLPWR
jgi:hypothetical protein